MQKYLDLRLDQIMGRYGFALGAVLLVFALLGLIVALRSGRAPRIVVGGLAVALVLGAALFAPAAPRLAAAVWRYVSAPAPPPPSGPLRVARVAATLGPLKTPSGVGEAVGPVVVRLFYPQAPDAPKAAPSAVGCGDLTDLPLADPGPQGRFPLLLYAPGFGNGADDNASSAAELASHGYVVMAIDDIERGKPEDPAQPFFDFSSDAAYAATLDRTAEKSLREARVALDALDRLAGCAGGAFARRVAFDRVGFFGFSFGGGVAANAAILDPRIAAAANIDGWVMGLSRQGGLEKPYMFLFDDEPIPPAKDLDSPDPATRNLAHLLRTFAQEQAQLLARPDAYGFWFRNVSHIGFSDRVFEREAALRHWLFADPARVKAVKDAYLLAFFDAYLRHSPQTLLTADPSPYVGVTPVKGRPLWPGGDEKVPPLAWFGLR